ncbi:MAG: cytochrome c oxidase assembly protein [Acidimicrobiales bacterium]
MAFAPAADDAPDIWRWYPHPEVWLLIAGIVGLGLYAVRVVGPKAVRDGSPIITRSQRRFFALGVVLLWLGADWPLHDIGERYLYAAHMGQHLLLAMVVAPLFLLATPTWLARLVLGSGWVGAKAVRWLCMPVAAGLLFNGFFVFTHWQPVVNNSVQYAALHYSLHLVLFATALLMWMPVCGPLPELRLSLPGQMVYLFCQSIVPTVPSAWLIFADKPVYDAYVHGYTVFGMTTVDDQQTAGVLMKLGAGMYLWALIAVLFARWAKSSMEADRVGIRVSERELTWDDVATQLDRAGPAPVEPTR